MTGTEKKTEPVITNPMCPCWSGFHFMHRPVCGCPRCEPRLQRPRTLWKEHQ